MATPQQLAGMSGLQAMQAILRGELPFAPIAQTLDFVLVDVSPGRAVFQGTPGLAHFNPLGSVHGGWFATLLDSALGCCVHAALPAGKAYTTLEIKVNMIRALTPKVQRVRAIGNVGPRRRPDGHRRGAAWSGPTAKLYAHGSTTCLIFEARMPA